MSPLCVRPYVKVHKNDDLSRRMLMLLSGMASELDLINDWIAAIDVEIKALAKADGSVAKFPRRRS